RREMQRATLAVTAAEAGRIENALRQWIGQHGGVLSGVQYGAQADFQLLVPPEEIDALERWRTQLGSANCPIKTPQSPRCASKVFNQHVHRPTPRSGLE